VNSNKFLPPGGKEGGEEITQKNRSQYPEVLEKRRSLTETYKMRKREGRGCYAGLRKKKGSRASGGENSKRPRAY